MTGTERIMPSHPVIAKRLVPHFQQVCYVLIVVRGNRKELTKQQIDHAERYVLDPVDVIEYYENWGTYKTIYQDVFDYFRSRGVLELEEMLDTDPIHVAFDIAGMAEPEIEAFPAARWNDYQRMTHGYNELRQSKDEHYAICRRFVRTFPLELIRGLRTP